MRTFLLSMLLFAASVEAQPPPPATVSVTLQWDPVTDARVQEVRIYYGAKSHLYDGYYAVAPPVNQATLNGLEEGELYFFAAATHNDVQGDGQLSREVRFRTPRGPTPNQTIQIDTQ